MRKLFSILAMGFLASAVSAAAVDLRITEVYTGGPGSNATVDWFEIYNNSSIDITLADFDGLFYVDKDTSKTPKAIEGIDTIKVGEAVVVLIADDDYETAIKDEFLSVWGENVNSVQIGYVSKGRGLGNDGDTVNLYIGDILHATVVVGDQNPATFVANGSADWGIKNGNNSWEASATDLASVGVLGAYQSNVPTLIGSPGMVVPEPATIALMSAAGLAALRRRK